MITHRIDGLPGVTMHGKMGPDGQRGAMTFCTNETDVNTKELFSNKAGYALPNANHNISIGIDITDSENPKTVVFVTNNILPIKNDYLLNIATTHTTLYKIDRSVKITSNIGVSNSSVSDVPNLNEISVSNSWIDEPTFNELIKYKDNQVNTSVDDSQLHDFANKMFVISTDEIIFNNDLKELNKEHENILKLCSYAFIQDNTFFSSLCKNVFSDSNPTYDIFILSKLDTWDFSNSLPSDMDLGVAVRSISVFKDTWQGCYEPHLVNKRTLYNSFDEKFKHLSPDETYTDNINDISLISNMALYCVNILGYEFDPISGELCIKDNSADNNLIPVKLEPIRISRGSADIEPILPDTPDPVDTGDTGENTPDPVDTVDTGDTGENTPDPIDTDENTPDPDDNDGSDFDDNNDGILDDDFSGDPKSPHDTIDPIVFDDGDNGGEDNDDYIEDEGENDDNPPSPYVPILIDDDEHEPKEEDDILIKFSNVLFGTDNNILGAPSDDNTSYPEINLKLKFTNAITNAPCAGHNFNLSLHFGYHLFFRNHYDFITDIQKDNNVLPVNVNGVNMQCLASTAQYKLLSEVETPPAFLERCEGKKFITDISGIKIKTDEFGDVDLNMAFNTELLDGLQALIDGQQEFMLAYISVDDTDPDGKSSDRAWVSDYFSSVFLVNSLTWPKDSFMPFVCKMLPKNLDEVTPDTYKLKLGHENELEYTDRVNASKPSVNTKFSALTDSFVYIDTSKPSLRAPLMTLESFLDEDMSEEAKNAFISEKEVIEYYSNKEFCPAEPKEFTFTQFVISTNLAAKDIEKIKIEAELYTPNSSFTSNISTCVNDKWDLSEYSDDEMPNLNTSKKTYYSKRQSALLEKASSSEANDLSSFKTITFESKYLTSSDINSDNLDTDDINAINTPLYKHKGFSKNYNYKLNFDNEQIVPCTIVIKDFGEKIIGSEFVSSILVPSSALDGANIRINAYYKKSSSIYSKIVLGNTTISETFE